MLTAICGAYLPDTAPPVCKCASVDPSAVAACVSPPAGPDAGLPGWGKGLIALVTIGVVASAGFAYYFRRRTVTEVESLVEEC